LYVSSLGNFSHNLYKRGNSSIAFLYAISFL
jgi:hypothetical protein